MPSPASVFHQPHAKVLAVPAWSLVPSPRNYNASIIEFEGVRLMAYRSHRMDQKGRCAIVICEMNSKWEGSKNVWLDLPEQVMSAMVHHEDPRLFTFQGRLHLAFTETQFHGEGRPYTCIMKYARLARAKKGWYVERAYWPRYGQNDGSHQEKNWQFFESSPGQLSILYEADPQTVLDLESDGETVKSVSKTDRELVKWPWGKIRGGTPPIRYGDEWLTVFHSATPYPFPPHWRRYYAGAYTFKATPPYAITSISQQPILVGSEHDGHANDPRNVDSWKPFVVFPDGIIQKDDFSYYVSYGVNDYLTAIAEHHDFFLGDPQFRAWGPKYFKTDNCDKMIRLFTTENKPPVFVKWTPVGRRVAGASTGVMSTRDPRTAMHLLEEASGEEISSEEFTHLTNVSK